MNKEYIEREAAIEFVKGLVDTMSVCTSIDECLGMKSMKSRALGALHDVPAADVLEVRHGQWLTNEYMYGDPDVGTEDMWIDRLAEQSDYYAYCSICGKAAGYNGEGSLVLSDYCPHCGAQMMKA